MTTTRTVSHLKIRKQFYGRNEVHYMNEFVSRYEVQYIVKRFGSVLKLFLMGNRELYFHTQCLNFYAN